MSENEMTRDEQIRASAISAAALIVSGVQEDDPSPRRRHFINSSQAQETVDVARILEQYIKTGR